jgi:hypothetical protein
VKEALPQAVPETVKEGHMPTRAALLRADRPDLAAAIRVITPASLLHSHLHIKNVQLIPASLPVPLTALPSLPVVWT